MSKKSATVKEESASAVEKAFPVPDASRYTLSFPFSALKKGGKIRDIRLAHIKEENGAFVCAEALVFHYEMERFMSGLFALQHEIIAAGKDARYVELISEARKMSGPYRILDMFNYYEKDGTERIFMVGRDYTYRTLADNCAYAKKSGGRCGTLHSERVFVGKGQTIFYSEPMNVITWPEGTYLAGEIKLVGPQGDIFSMKSLHDKLYLFFEKGIYVLTSYVSPLECKAAPVPFDMGNLIEDSCAICGEAIYFFTERGLCAINESGCKPIEEADIREINLQEHVYATSFRGKYLASVCNLQGERVIFCYDVLTKRSYFINHNCEFLCASFGIFLTQGKIIYELTGKSLPTAGECALTIDFSLDSKNALQYLESICVDGSGEMTARITNENGDETTAVGECGKRLRFPRALRGEAFRLKLSPKDENFCIRNLSFGVRGDSL